MNKLRKALLQHAVIFTALVLGTLITIFILGQFNDLHPNAYRDGVLSIVYVYIVIFILHLLFITLQTQRFGPLKRLYQRLEHWERHSGVLAHIAMMFTLITVVNSVMMLTGIDAPKTGTFAYAHLLTRTLIVTLAGVLWQFKKVLNFVQRLGKPKPEALSLNRRLANFFDQPFNASTLLFTSITVIGCLVMVNLSSILNPQGGASLYLSLIILYGLIFILSYFIHLKKRSRQAVS